MLLKLNSKLLRRRFDTTSDFVRTEKKREGSEKITKENKVDIIMHFIYKTNPFLSKPKKKGCYQP